MTDRREIMSKNNNMKNHAREDTKLKLETH